MKKAGETQMSVIRKDINEDYAYSGDGKSFQRKI